MLLRITAVLFACMALPAHALELSPAPADPKLTATASVASRPASENSAQGVATPSETPIGSYGLALATLALVGFMARR